MAHGTGMLAHLANLLLQKTVQVPFHRGGGNRAAIKTTVALDPRALQLEDILEVVDKPTVGCNDAAGPLSNKYKTRRQYIQAIYQVIVVQVVKVDPDLEDDQVCLLLVKGHAWLERPIQFGDLQKLLVALQNWY